MMRLYIVTGANGHLGGTMCACSKEKGAGARAYSAGETAARWRVFPTLRGM